MSRKSEPQQEGHAHVERRVHAEIHPRKAYEHNYGKKEDAPALFRPHAQAAEAGEGVLRVAAGEGITRGPGSRGLDYREVRVQDPGPRYAEAELHELVGDRPDETRGEYVEAEPLAHAPVDGDGQRHIQGLAAQLRDEAEQPVQEGAADTLQKIKKLHLRPSRSDESLDEQLHSYAAEHEPAEYARGLT